MVEQPVQAGDVHARVAGVRAPLDLKQPLVLQPLRGPVHGVDRPPDAAGEHLAGGDVVGVRGIVGLTSALVGEGGDGRIERLVDRFDTAVACEQGVELDPVDGGRADDPGDQIVAHTAPPGMRAVGRIATDPGCTGTCTAHLLVDVVP
ncbi:hypothetical protein ABZX75_28335 [Streptomyces sp. NPDC003038]|uniref:hypothetical protein n=1 Tax=unclassified Streptomyces TaxID=2593676 RepID=UPI0033A2C4E9